MSKKIKVKAMKKSELLNAFNKFGKDRKVKVLNSAIDYMEQYNGRSKSECIALSTAEVLNVFYDRTK